MDCTLTLTKWLLLQNSVAIGLATYVNLVLSQYANVTPWKTKMEWQVAVQPRALHRIRRDMSELERIWYLKSTRSRSSAQNGWNKENKTIHNWSGCYLCQWMQTNLTFFCRFQLTNKFKFVLNIKILQVNLVGSVDVFKIRQILQKETSGCCFSNFGEGKYAKISLILFKYWAPISDKSLSPSCVTHVTIE